MPNKTFFNLSEQKQENLINIALKEFCDRDYDSASISGIARQAGIAQGSLYQYFANKKDLYLYLLDLLCKTKSSFLQDNYPSAEEMTFFEYLSWVFEINLQFDLAYPAFSQLAYRTFYGGAAFSDPVIDRMKQASTKFIRQVIAKGIEEKDIDPNIDADLAVHVVESLINSVSKYIPEKQGITADKLAETGATSIDLDLARNDFQQLIEVLRFGLNNKNK